MRETLLARARQCTILIFVATITASYFAVSARAQNASRSDDVSALARENLNEVAAPAMQIKAILLQDPGLMVLLKDWVAEDATDHGQVLTVDDLTDAAIYERLETDVQFRSIATRLVQKYGYLMPEVNPTSQMGQQQLMVMQERAKLVAQQDQQSPTQQHTSNAQPAASATAACAQAPSFCVPQAAAPATAAPVLPTAGPATASPLVPAPPLEPSPISPGDRVSLQRAGYMPSQSGGDLATLGLTDGSSAANPFASSQALDPAAALDVPTSFLGGPPAGPNPQLETLSPAHPASSPLIAGRPFTDAGQPSASTEPSLVRAADPYRDIPSLYDMYLQATPQPAMPARFGFAVFENGIRDPQSIPMDLPVGPDYVVGPGDGLAIDLWGGMSQRLYGTVDREGRISLPEVGPVLVAGKSLGQVQQTVQQLLRTQFRDISVDVSLSRLRTIRVYEVGDVAKPGAYDISSLSTPLNALFAAGGPTAQGSMRVVKHYRGNQLIEEVDLYDLLLHGIRTGMAPLENGDTILVPPLGPEVTVEGMVRRPAIYELKDEKTLADAIELAGGMLPAASLRHIEVERLVAHNMQTMLSLDIPETDDDAAATQKLDSFRIQDGDRIRIYPIAPYNHDAVYLEGHVLRPGRYSYRANMHVGDLIGSYKDLLPEPSTSYAEIIRLNPPDFHPTVVSFDLGAALDSPASSPALEPMDTVRVFSKYDFQNPPTITVSGDVRAPGTYETSGQVRLADAVHVAGGLSPDAQTKDAQIFRALPNGEAKVFSVNLAEALSGDPADNIELQARDRILIHGDPNALRPATVSIEGNVARPGRYPLTNNMTVADLIQIGGGLKASADTKTAELTSYEFSHAKAGETQLTAQHQDVSIAAAMARDKSADVLLHNGDVVTIREVPGWNDLEASIALKGQVMHPGTYGIRPGERLSSVVERAGGFQKDAYPYGAILERTEVRELESEQQAQLVARLKSEGASLENLPDTTLQQKAAKYTTLQQYQQVLTQLAASSPVGRVAIRISPKVRDWKGTPADIVVRAGDVLVVPRRPGFVMVTGQVFNPTAVSYRPGRSAKWYLSQSGGPTNLANKKAMFVLRADGSVIGAKQSFIGGNPMSSTLEPGDTIIVPEKAISGGFQWANLFTSAQVASGIVSTVFIALHY